jgi:ubiquitin carboxyl-terminal hydrolase 9/24
MIRKFFCSPFLEKRVRAAVELKQLIEEVEANGQFRPKLGFSRQDLIKFIEDVGVLEHLILGENVHPELIKRSTEIVIFLDRHGKLEPSVFDTIWQQTQTKHETDVLAFY